MRQVEHIPSDLFQHFPALPRAAPTAHLCGGASGLHEGRTAGHPLHTHICGLQKGPQDRPILRALATAAARPSMAALRGPRLQRVMSALFFFLKLLSVPS